MGFPLPPRFIEILFTYSELIWSIVLDAFWELCHIKTTTSRCRKIPTRILKIIVFLCRPGHQPQAATDLSVTKILCVLEFRINGVVHYEAFCVWLFLFMLLHVLVICSFVVLHSVPEKGLTTICLSIHQFMDNWVVSSLPPYE